MSSGAAGSALSPEPGQRTNSEAQDTTTPVAEANHNAPAGVSSSLTPSKTGLPTSTASLLTPEQRVGDLSVGPDNGIAREHEDVGVHPSRGLDDDTSGDLSDLGEGESDWPSDTFDPDLKRVKVYELIGSRWTDRGTAFCQGDFDHAAQEAKLVARSESNMHEVILSCTIRSNDVYQRQQDTLIVWTEPDGTDYALSFQENEGCAEVWDFIVEVQRHLNGGEEATTAASSSPQMGPQPSLPIANIIRSGQLPPPSLGIMSDIETAIKILARTPAAKERLCESIRSQDYLKSMIDVMSTAEDLESLENLHALCSCMQTILLLNDHSMYEYILDDCIFLGVVGMLEYDPEFPTYKANYRDFLTQTSRFKQPIPFHDAAIQKKIHQTYRLQYLKDVILARALDDSTFNVLNSCIIFNQIDIIHHVQNNDKFLSEVVGLFADEDTLAGGGIHSKAKDKAVEGQELMDVETVPERAKANVTDEPSSTDAQSPDGIEQRRDVVLLIQQLCAMGKNVQLPARINMFRALVDRGILFAVQWALCQPEKRMLSTAGEILAVMLDHDTNGVRSHVLKQVQAFEKDREAGKKDVDKKETILQLLCRMMAVSLDLAVQNQLGDALRVLLEIPQTESNDNPQSQVAGMKLLARTKDDPTTERFLDYFYKFCIQTLTKPFSDLPEYKTVTDIPLELMREKANLYLYLCDLLCNFALQHSFRSHFFILSSNVSSRVASLLRVKDKHLRLAALRFFRICLKLNNRNLFNHMIKHDVLAPILNLTALESRRDNLLSSSCQEFFEHMRKENFKDLINHCMTRHEAKVRELAETLLGGPRFKAFIRRWEMNTEPPPKEGDKGDSVPTGPRRWGQGRLMESEEEDYFNADDDDDESTPAISSQWSRVQGPGTNILKRKRARGSPVLTLPPRRQVRLPTPSPTRTPPLSLVDYDEDEDLGGLGPAEAMASSRSASPSVASNRSPQLGSSPRLPMPDGPILSHRRIGKISIPKRRQGDDDILPATQFDPGPSLPQINDSLNSEPLIRPGEKRRRDEHDDDELLERLASKAKRASVGAGPEKIGAVSGKATPEKPGEEGRKKIKLKLGSGSAIVAAPVAAPPDTNTKDGDTG